MTGETGEPTSMPPINQEALAAQARLLSELATRPEFIALVQEIQYAPESERLATAERLANIQSLRDRGVDLPEGFRLTTRFFENPNNLFTGSVRIDAEDRPGDETTAFTPGPTICASLGYIVCITVGETEIAHA